MACRFTLTRLLVVSFELSYLCKHILLSLCNLCFTKYCSQLPVNLVASFLDLELDVITVCDKVGYPNDILQSSQQTWEDPVQSQVC